MQDKEVDQSALFTVILTGGVASGKSAAADFFSEFGVPIIDTDNLARAVVAPGTAGLRALINTFGDKILQTDGSLNRRQLRQIVFADDQLRLQLEKILHPRIEMAARQQLIEVKETNPDYVMIAVPLYTETQTFRWADRVLMIDVSPETQLARVQQRDQISQQLAQQMLDAQASREQRLAIADDIIVNESSLNTLQCQCLRIHKKYCMHLETVLNSVSH